jgi:4-aminobutyrate aminotransferase-like enzyme
MEAAIKLAVYVQKKHQIVAFKGGFHGRTLGALSITTSKQKYRDGYDPLLYPVEFLDFPHTLHSKKSLGQMIDDINTTPVLNKNVAAVIIEPILGEGGYYIAPPEYLQALQDRCQSLGILLIIDEVQTGIARTGSWFYFQQLGLTPDIITLAKGLGSGMPIGACMAKKEIMDQWRPGAHGGTYGGNPVSCAAALATLSVLENYLESVKTLGRWALAMLQDAIGSHPVVGEIRGVGLMIGIEFVNDKNQPNPDAMKRVIDYCLDHHVIVISCGIYDNVIRIIPPLIIDKSLLNQGLSVVIDGVRACDH